MFKRYEKLKKKQSNNEEKSCHFVSKLENSFSSIQSLDTSRINLSPSPSSDEEGKHYVINEQFQAIQLAQILEKTAFELRVFSNRKKREFSPQM